MHDCPTRSPSRFSASGGSPPKNRNSVSGPIPVVLRIVRLTQKQLSAFEKMRLQAELGNISGLGELIGLTPPISGSCLCGSVSYVCLKAPVWSVNCHCSACQKLSGAPYVSAFSVPTDSFGLTGDTTIFLRSSDAGHVVTTTHCATCGTRVFAQSAGARHLVNVFASTLTDTSAFITSILLKPCSGQIAQKLASIFKRCRKLAEPAICFGPHGHAKQCLSPAT